MSIEGTAEAWSGFEVATRDWFAGAFEGPTAAQLGAWQAITAQKHVLVVAPTGSGKTLAAFLWAIDRLHHEPMPPAHLRCRVLYVSPLKALAADVQRNLRSPLTGIAQAAARAGISVPQITVGMRTGDTPQSERRTFAKRPPDILVTTPESLFLMLTSAARAGLAGVETVIVDEIHAVAGTKRGAHLALSLERLDEHLVAYGSRPAQRVGLSATVRPVEEVAQFLAGHRAPTEGGREVVVVQPPAAKEWDIKVAVAVPDLTDPEAPIEPTSGTRRPAPDAPNAEVSQLAQAPAPAKDPRTGSVWPYVEDRIVDLIAAHRATLVFTNSRRGAERLTARINEIWATRQGHPVGDPGASWAAEQPGASYTAAAVAPEAPVLARAHHGSMSRTERTLTETALKEGRLPAVVATSSLELGIDMGAVDLVIQVGAPPSVASGLQRIGRAGHQVGAVSRGVVFPTHRGDLINATVVSQRMQAGQIEEVQVPRTPLDVLAQQIVAALALDEWDAAQLLALVRRAHPYRELGDATWAAVLDMLAGRYPSEEFAELRARIIWDRAANSLSARPGALRLAATSGGTIPDRGLYGVFLAGAETERGSRRVGELDEEMVYESRVGDTFTLGSSTWRIEDITPHQVLVTPAPGLPGRLPFWRGDQPGRPVELGRAVGEFVRRIDARLRVDPAGGLAELQSAGLDDWAAENLADYLAEQRIATGVVPSDRAVVVETFRDELGDWRVVLHSPFGARVHAPWSLVLAARLRERHGIDVAAMHSDDGVVLRLPDLAGDWELAESPAKPLITAEDLLIDPEEVDRLVQHEVGSSVLFAARFREAAARALLLPRRHPGRRQPLWQQRQRSAQLLQVAAAFPQFPITLEAARECLQDMFDVAALRQVMADIDKGKIRLVEARTPSPSPFAQSLLFAYTAAFLYDGDAPLAERRAAALSLDPDLLAELLGERGTEIGDLLDTEVVLRTQEELLGLSPHRQARTQEELWDLLRRTGPWSRPDLEARTAPEARGQVPDWLANLIAARRVISVRLVVHGGDEGATQYALAEDAGRLRDALGVALPMGLPEVFTELLPDPLGDLVQRHLRSHAPTAAARIAERLGLGVTVVLAALHRLEAAGKAVRGALLPSALGGSGDEWADPEVLRTLRRRSLAALRAEVEPVAPASLGAFLPQWQHIRDLTGTATRGDNSGLSARDALLRAVEQLAGVAVPASALETLVLPARVAGYRPELLDELTIAGEVLWAGHTRVPGSGGGDGLVSLHLADDAPLTLPIPEPLAELWPQEGDDHHRVHALLHGGDQMGGGFFLPRLAELAGLSQAATLEVLWDLVWAGHVTNDSFAPVREVVGRGPGGAHRAPRATTRAAVLRPRRFGRSRFALAAGEPRSASGTAVPVHGGGGRWSALPQVEPDPTARAFAAAQLLLERHGVVTRAVTAAEGASAVYRVFRELEERGAIRRGYFVTGLGGAQFALPGAVDELRAADQQCQTPQAATPLLLAATDPANPYGAALPWPQTAGAKPGRKAGAVVLLANGELVAYVERGGRTLLTFTEDCEALAATAQTLARAVSEKVLPRLTITKLDGQAALEAAKERTPAAICLLEAGFTVTPSGLRVRPARQPEREFLSQAAVAIDTRRRRLGNDGPYG